MKELASVEGVDFHLQDCWLYLAVLKNLSKHCCIDVTAADVAHQSFLDEFFHGMVRLLISDSGIVRDHAWVFIAWLMNPLRRVAVLDWYMLQGNREVDQIKVEVVKTQIS